MDAWMNKWMNECRNGQTNGMICMVVKPNWFSLFVLKRKIKKKRFDKSQLWYLVNIFSLDIRNKSFSWYLWSVSGIRRVRLKQILLESRQICWNTFLRYALYNVDSTIIWFLVDFKKKYNSQNWRRRELDKLVEEACVCTKFCEY